MLHFITKNYRCTEDVSMIINNVHSNEIQLFD